MVDYLKVYYLVEYPLKPTRTPRSSCLTPKHRNFWLRTTLISCFGVECFFLRVLGLGFGGSLSKASQKLQP